MATSVPVPPPDKPFNTTAYPVVVEAVTSAELAAKITPELFDGAITVPKLLDKVFPAFILKDQVTVPILFARVESYLKNFETGPVNICLSAVFVVAFATNFKP